MINAYLRLGFKDYVAARHLLLDGFLLQGTILGSTAVEKYLKAVLWALGEQPRGHLDQPRLQRHIKDCLPRMYGEFNQDFFDLLGRVYKLRYSDGLSESISAGIEQYKVLAELDRTVHTIESTLQRIDSATNKPIESQYARALQEGQSMVCRENHIALGVSKAAYVQRKQKLLIVHVDQLARTFEVSHDGVRPIDDGVFSRPTLTPSDDRLSLDIEFSGDLDEIFDEGAA